jgi:hypothetical protein
MKRTLIVLVLLVGGLTACDKGGGGGNQAQIQGMLAGNVCNGRFNHLPVDHKWATSYWVQCYPVQSGFGFGFGYSNQQQQAQYSNCHGVELYNEANQKVMCN